MDGWMDGWWLFLGMGTLGAVWKVMNDWGGYGGLMGLG
jgi:hypothetical protein